MKSTKFTAMLLSAALFTVACSKDESVTAPSVSKGNSVTLTNEVIQARLKTMSNNNDIWTRGAGHTADIVVPAAPAVPAGAVDLTTVAADHPHNATEGEVLHIPAGTSYDQAIGFYYDGSDLYVEGDLILDPTSWGKGNIYVLEGGSITFKDKYTLNDLNLYSWGNINLEGSFTVNNTASLFNYTECALEVAGEDGYIDIISHFESVGGVAASRIQIIGPAEWEAKRVVKFGSCVSAGLLEISNHAEFYITNKGLLVEDLKLHSYSNLYVTNGTLVQVMNEISFENHSCFVNLGTEYAVIDAHTVTIDDNAYIQRINGGPVDLNYEVMEDDHSGTEIQWAANVVFNKTMPIPSQGCLDDFPGPGEPEIPGEPEGPKEPVIEHDKIITSPDIERISATSIDFHNGRVFVSWHEAEANYQGYIDVVNMESAEIEATLHTHELDFNHMYINEGIAYVTGGDNKRGAFYSAVAYNTGSSSVSVDVNYVGGASGNCITIDGGNKWVVSGANGGLNILDSENTPNYTALPEAKFVEPYKNGMAVLAGVNSTYIYEYDLAGNRTSELHVGSIAPLDGKNTLHAEGNTIYACLSKRGLVKVTDGVISPLTLSEDQIGSINCVDTDEDYIYIANGKRGLTIVDKTTWETVKEYTLGGASANYIKLGEDGYIYVAYGLKGVHRFKLVK